MKKILAAFLATALTACATSAPPIKMAGHTLRISNKGGVGSGVHIGGGLVLTAGHVAESQKTGQLIFETDTGVKLSGTLLWQNWKAGETSVDLALMQVPEIEADFVRISCAENYVGQEVEIEGNPGGEPFVTSWGRVGKIKGSVPGFWSDVSYLDATVLGGVSGGPVVAKNSNELVGIVVGMMPNTGYAAMVPGATICKMLGRV